MYTPVNLYFVRVKIWKLEIDTMSNPINPRLNILLDNQITALKFDKKSF